MNVQKSCIIPSSNKKLGITVFNEHEQEDYKPINIQITNEDLKTPRPNEDFQTPRKIDANDDLLETPHIQEIEDLITPNKFVANPVQTKGGEYLRDTPVKSMMNESMAPTECNVAVKSIVLSEA